MLHLKILKRNPDFVLGFVFNREFINKLPSRQLFNFIQFHQGLNGCEGVDVDAD
jgi:hypothetical protein